MGGRVVIRSARGTPRLRKAVLSVGVAALACADFASGQACDLEFEAAPLNDGQLVSLVRSMEANPDGRIYSTHPFEGSVRVEGLQFWPGVGAQLDGGDVRPWTLGWLGDTLYVTDESGAYALFLDSGGSAIKRRSFAAPRPQPPFVRTSFSRFLDGGRVLFEAVASVEAMASGLVSSTPLLAAADGIGAVDTLAWLARRQVVMRIDLDSATMSFVGQPFGDGALFAVGTNGERIVVADREVDASSPAPTYAITALTAHGDTLFRRHYDYEPIRMRESWKAAAMDQVAGRLSAPPGMSHEELVSRIRQAIYLPAWLPPVSRIVLDRVGRVWVRREVVPGNNSIRWETLSPSGAREGSLELPTSLSVRAADGFVLWATEAAEARMHRLWRIDARPC